MDTSPAEAPSPPSSPTLPPFPVVVEDPSALPMESEGGKWDWGNLLDFSVGVDEYHHQHQVALPFPHPWDTDESPVEALHFLNPSTETGTSSRVRKRDPRLSCENYLAGRVPCACPEMEEDEEEMVAGKEGTGDGGARKKARLGGASGGVIRCQVPGCEVDIRELKGYHRRHRVCLRCANALSVKLDGERKRYCQQCGKFHILAAFDEGKHSCRRKLERHNKRRRRRTNDSKDVVEKESEISENMNIVSTLDNDEWTKDSLKETSHGSDSLHVSDKSGDADMLQEPDKHDSLFCSEPSVRASHSNSISSFAVSSEAQLEGMDKPVSVISSSIYKKKSILSTTCPTGRISFKLYDWNPAEFPRRLRHQIFQWLASMPVELEGYIRPGCTILTLFIAMPHLMWNKLSKDAAQFLRDFICSPDCLLFRRGNMHIYLNDTLFQVLQDGTSLVNVKMEVQVPKIHLVHPVVFEAGKPVEFFACGSNIFQSNFRFLVSFAGKYLEHELEKLKCEVGLSQHCEHQIFKIRITQTKPGLFGPAFIEVENDSGLSNFVSILLVDKHVCSELQKMQQSGSLDIDVTLPLQDLHAISSFCEVTMSRQSPITELFLDIAWLLKVPKFESHDAFFSIGNIQRLNNVLGYLVQIGSVNILKKVLHYVESLLNEKQFDNHVDRNHADIQLFEKNIDDANKILHQKLLHVERSVIDLRNITCKGLPTDQADTKSDIVCASLIEDQEMEEQSIRDGDESMMSSVLHEETTSLIKTAVEKGNFLPVKWPLQTCDIFYRTITNTRIAVFVMASVVVCFGFCIALFHPHKAGEYAISVRRRMFGIVKQ